MCALLPPSNFVGGPGVEHSGGLVMESTPVGLRETCAVVGKEINLPEFYSTSCQSPVSTLSLSEPPACVSAELSLDCELYEASSVFIDSFLPPAYCTVMHLISVQQLLSRIQSKQKMCSWYYSPCPASRNASKLHGEGADYGSKIYWVHHFNR